MMPLILMLAACTPPPRTDTETAGDGCNAARHEALIGQPRAQAERLALYNPFASMTRMPPSRWIMSRAFAIS
jgi:hypothetical protein